MRRRRVATDARCGPGGKARFDDGKLVFLHRHRVAVEAAGAGRLAQGGAHPPGKLREAVGLGEPGQGLAQVSGIDQIVPLRRQVVERAPDDHASQLHPGLAEGHAALHTPGRLTAALLLREHGVELVPVVDARQRRLAGVTLTAVF